MKPSYRVLGPHDVQVEASQQEFARDVLLGLSSSPKSLSSRYFYDERGNRLFQRIMELPEYYPTACEMEILRGCRHRFAGLFGREPFNLVELGAGDGQKTKVLLDAFRRGGLDFRYVPIDICEPAVRELVGECARDFPGIDVDGLVTEYFDGLRWLSGLNGRRNVVLFLGSNIGNFDVDEARVFLHSLWNSLNDGDWVLVGFDLKKEVRRLLRAYDDSQGITARFNLNLLERINRELEGTFDTAKFDFYSTFNVFSGAVESFLVSRERQSVHIGLLRQSFLFLPWEPVRTEVSHKYLPEDIASLAAATGFRVVEDFTDSTGSFTDSLWQVRKGTGVSR